MEKKTLIIELEKISKSFFDVKDYVNAGTINLAIDVIKQLKQQLNQKEEK